MTKFIGIGSITAEKLAKILLQHPKARVYVQCTTNNTSHVEPVLDCLYDENKPYCRSIKFEKNEKSGREKIILNYF